MVNFQLLGHILTKIIYQQHSNTVVGFAIISHFRSELILQSNYSVWFLLNDFLTVLADMTASVTTYPITMQFSEWHQLVSLTGDFPTDIVTYIGEGVFWLF